MSDVVLVRQEVVPGKTEKLRAWCAELEEREDEVLETLDDEGVYTESRFLRSTPEGDYLFTFFEAEDHDEAKAAVEETDHPIDAEHAAVMDEVIVEGSTELHAPLDHFPNPNRP